MHTYIFNLEPKVILREGRKISFDKAGIPVAHEERNRDFD